MSIDYSIFKFGKGKPRVLNKHAKDTEHKAALKGAKDAVDARDKHVCQVRGTPLSPDHANAWKALERHHLAEQSVAKDRFDDPDNILTVSRGVHQLMQSHALVPVNAKGEEVTRVSEIKGYMWNPRLVQPGKEPFRLRAHKEWVA
jgi:hypothetical protein